jgi:hypothetical protein
MPASGVSFDEWTRSLSPDEKQKLTDAFSRTSFGLPSKIYPYNKYWAFRGFIHEVWFKLTHRLPRFIIRQCALVKQKVISARFIVVKLCGFGVHQALYIGGFVLQGTVFVDQPFNVIQ